MARTRQKLPIPSPHVNIITQESNVCCQTCPYWFNPTNKDYGECRKNPPTFIPESPLTKDGPLGRFILTASKTFCSCHPLFNTRLSLI